MTSLGIAPDHITLNLPTGSDFDAVWQSYDPVTGQATDWPAGTVWSLVFDTGTEWEAVTSGSDATWSVDKATADTIPHGTKVKLRYVNGTTDHIYLTGTVVRYA